MFWPSRDDVTDSIRRHHEDNYSSDNQEENESDNGDDDEEDSSATDEGDRREGENADNNRDTSHDTPIHNGTKQSCSCQCSCYSVKIMEPEYKITVCISRFRIGIFQDLARLLAVFQSQNIAECCKITIRSQLEWHFDTFAYVMVR